MIYGLDEYYSDLLAEARSPEEIKKILEYQFVQGKGVPEDVFAKIFEIDPTKKKSYTRWVLSQYDNYSEQIRKSLSDGKLQKMFKTFKERAGQGLDLTNIENFEKALEYIPDADPVLEKEGNPGAPENEFEVVYDTPEWTSAVPHTYEADKKLGRGCRWCTAGAFGDNDYYWNRYSSAGPLWVNFDRRSKEVAPMDHKEYPYKRYQFLFEWQNYAGELMDSNDRRVVFEDVDMPEEVVEFYEKQNPKYKEVIENGGGDPQERWDDYNQERWDCCIVVLCYRERQYLSLFPEQNDAMNLNVDYLLYDEEDSSDPAFMYRFNPQDYHIFSDSGSGDDGYDVKHALLKTTNGENVFVYCEDRGDGGWTDWGAEVITKYKLFDNIFAGVSMHGELLVAPMNDLCQSLYVESFRADNVLRGKKIEDIFLNQQVTGTISYGDYNYYAIELVLSNGEHTLLAYGNDGLRVMVQNDKPVDGEQFTVSRNENGIMEIRGQKFSYKFNEMEDDESNINETDRFDVDGKTYYIVKLGKGGNFGIYSTEKKSLLFQKRYVQIDKNETSDGNIFLFCYSPKGSDTVKDIYDVRGEQFIANGVQHATFLFRNQPNTYFAAGNDGDCSIYSLEGGVKKIASFAYVMLEIPRNDDLSCVLVKDANKFINIFSCKLRKLLLPQETYVKYGLFNKLNASRYHENCVMFARKRGYSGDEVVDIYNYVEGKVCLENCEDIDLTYRLVVLEGDKFKDGLRIVTSADRKRNLMDTDGNFILP